MICPSCGIGIAIDFFNKIELNNHDNVFDVIYCDRCPSCNELIVKLRQVSRHEFFEEFIQQEKIIYPSVYSRKVEAEVPRSYKKEFLEACAVLSLSPKSSAALSRRLLQQILREEYKIQCPNLAQEIDKFIKLPDIPAYVKDAVDAIRNVGNFAAHPLKDTQTGQILEVETGEAEWLIGVLETLFDITFVQPKRLAEKQKKLNEKLKKAGKPPMKKS
jgi:hypothetical protein